MLVGALVTATMKHERQGLVFWDEPDNHLAPIEVGPAVLGLRKIAENSGRAGYGDHQVMMASHHPETVRRFSSDDTSFCGGRRISTARRLHASLTSKSWET